MCTYWEPSFFSQMVLLRRPRARAPAPVDISETSCVRFVRELLRMRARLWLLSF